MRADNLFVLVIMKKLSLISSFLLLAFICPVLADGDKHQPFKWHGSATRIAPDGTLMDKPGTSNHPLWLVKPLKPVYERMESPSAGGGGEAGSCNTFAKCLGKVLCPVNWFKRAPKGE